MAEGRCFRSKMSIMKRTFILTVALAFAACSGGYYIKRTLPDTRYSRVAQGEIVMSISGIRLVGSEKRLVYRQWKFAGADEKTVFLSYEEYYDSLKEKPDLTEEMKLIITENAVSFAGYRLDIFELSATQISYYIKVQEK